MCTSYFIFLNNLNIYKINEIKPDIWQQTYKYQSIQAVFRVKEGTNLVYS